MPRILTISALRRVCEQHGAELIFADIPMLLDNVPGKATVDQAIQDTRCLNIKAPESLLKTEHFYDHMHLNREGVEVFLQHHLLQKLN